MQQGADCDHAGRTIYTRRTINGGEQVCIQCLECRRIVKSPAHGHRPYIKLTEVPAGETIYPFIEAARDDNE